MRGPPKPPTSAEVLAARAPHVPRMHWSRIEPLCGLPSVPRFQAWSTPHPRPACGGWCPRHLRRCPQRDRAGNNPRPARQLAGGDPSTHERYLGQSEPIDPRAGHIPGARSLPIDEVAATGRFPDPATARRILGPVGDREIVASCGSGITACVLIALARRAGRDARLLEGSWSGWCEDPARPVCRSVCGDELTSSQRRTTLRQRGSRHRTGRSRHRSTPGPKVASQSAHRDRRPPPAGATP
ncbi:Rhodanese domain protein [Acidimicrobium ferrooxidans DSM 10331]|uniref:Rhodanese domain protein n=1 Tax=Acidimicrobium ferrooxidans (strain DSM 10331 / JCM 15462 / NBRC 103882 / ICP) TaxID=525909 RepID=C7M2B0_ACIFD|nr:Rhodanese domain protein [Acidimicrobium ferrooxidans DSM 10331]